MKKILLILILQGYYTCVQSYSKPYNPVSEQTDSGDSAIIASILKGNLDSTIDLVNLRFQTFIIYKKDTLKTNSLWAIAQLSEYLNDYQVAANCYSVLLKRLDKINQKAEFSKATAHKIACRFLAQSQVLKDVDTTKVENSQDGYYSMSGTYAIVNGHLFITNLPIGRQAEKAGLLACDEITHINSAELSNGFITADNLVKQLRGEKGASFNFKVKRLGEYKPRDINVQCEFVSSKAKINEIDTLKGDAIKKREMKQNFFKAMVTAIKKDTTILHDIETAQKLTYALAIINKWTKEPINNKYILQLDEQLGMLSSIITMVKGSNPTFNFEGKKISFANPELREMIGTEEAKEAQLKFDSLAHTQPAKETKIDENVSFVENDNFSNVSGQYACEEIIENSQKSNKGGFLSPFECLIPNYKYNNNFGSTIVEQPLMVNIVNGLMSIIQSNTITTQTQGKTSVSEWIGNVEGQIIKNEGVLKGFGSRKYNEPTEMKGGWDLIYHVKIIDSNHILIKEENIGHPYNTTGITYGDSTRLVRYKKIQ